MRCRVPSAEVDRLIEVRFQLGSRWRWCLVQVWCCDVWMSSINATHLTRLKRYKTPVWAYSVTAANAPFGRALVV